MRNTVLCLLVIAGVGSFAAIDAPFSRADEVPKALSFSLKDTHGKNHTLEQYKDKFVVLEWIEPACPTCRRHAKDSTINGLVKKYEKNKDVVILGICTSSSTDAESMQAFMNMHKLKYTVLMDPTGKVVRMFGAKKTPHMFVLSKGKVVYKGAMDNDPRGKLAHDERVNYIGKALDELIAGKKISTASTKPYG